jgi:hypothetical protein
MGEPDPLGEGALPGPVSVERLFEPDLERFGVTPRSHDQFDLGSGD